jgi:CBS domain-containing protein
MLTARDVMTRKLLVAQADWSLEDLAAFLTEHSIGGAPVTDGKKIVGMVSSTDLVRTRTAEESDVPDARHLLENAQKAGIAPYELSTLTVTSSGSGRTVRDIMSPFVFDVDESTPVHEVADAMLRGRIHRVLVTSRGLPIGLVTALDLLAIVRDLRDTTVAPAQSASAPAAARAR